MNAKTPYLKLKRFSFFNVDYAILDTAEYLADQLFIQHKVAVKFIGEYAKEGTMFRVVLCRIRKKDEKEFLKAIEELPGKMLLFGHSDFPKACEKMGKMLSSEETS